MLESTFVFLNGIGESTERRFWDGGILNWHDFLDASLLPGISPKRKSLYDADLTTAIQHLERGHSRYFAQCLKPRDHWRLFDQFRSRTVFLDIETTGEPTGYGHITMVGLYGKGRMTSLVFGDTLTQARLNEELAQYDMIVTFFGTGFDLPYLRATYPRLSLHHAHFDLCFAARRLGLKGGLKHIELEVGLHRAGSIQGLDGWDAVRLWHAWQAGDAEAGRLLKAYNEADVRNLEPLAEFLYGEFLTRFGPDRRQKEPGKRGV